MAKLSQLVPAIADVLGLPEKTVHVFARHLREAGLISSGGRGPGAADMTPHDVANLVIAVAGSTFVKDAVPTVDHYAELPAQSSERSTRIKTHRFENLGNEPPIWDLRRFPIVRLRTLARGHSFRDALAALTAAAADGSLKETIAALPQKRVGDHVIPTMYSIEVTLWGPYPEAAIRLLTDDFSEQMRYGEDIPVSDYEDVKQWETETAERYGLGDLKQMRMFTEQTIFALGDLLSERH